MFKNSYTVNEFDKLGDFILNNIIINSNETKFRLCEIEFYYYNETHKDEYVHKSPDQKQYGKFYFHKFHNGTYKSGTFKGLDIVLGSNETYFGVLIRSIKNIDTGEFIEGSCNVANKLLSCFNVQTVKELFEKHYLNIQQISITDDKLKLEKTALDLEPVYCGPRIGLSDKYPEFKDKKYRYAIFIDKIKKQRKTFEPLKIQEEQKA
jgi:3-methyladenine DNA glycosylase Mpg